MGCRKSGSSTITLLAAAPNGKEALKVTGHNGTIINGAKWYRSKDGGGSTNNDNSYGFVDKSSKMKWHGSHSPDQGSTKAEMRLSYNLAGNAGGYRCGNATGLNNVSGWERLYYHAE